MLTPEQKKEIDFKIKTMGFEPVKREIFELNRRDRKNRALSEEMFEYAKSREFHALDAEEDSLARMQKTLGTNNKQNVLYRMAMRKKAIFGLFENSKGVNMSGGLTVGSLMEKLKPLATEMKIIVGDMPAFNVSVIKYEFAHGYEEEEGYTGSPDEQIEKAVKIS